MSLISWEDKYTVEVEEIDDQHKRLISMINDLHNAMKEKKGKEKTEEILDGLENYVDEHFSTEEEYFDEYDYPEKEMHKEEHRIFEDKVADFIEDYKDGKVLLSMKIINFLKDWLVNHINGTDQRYVSFFDEKGLS